jgi:hypothetical protein
VLSGTTEAVLVGSGGASDSVSGGGGDSGGTGDRRMGRLLVRLLVPMPDEVLPRASHTKVTSSSFPSLTARISDRSTASLPPKSPPSSSTRHINPTARSVQAVRHRNRNRKRPRMVMVGMVMAMVIFHSPRPDRPNMRVVASDLLTAVKPDHSGDQEGSGLRPGMREHRSEMVTESDAEKDSGPLRVLIVEDNTINRNDPNADA